MLTLVFKRYLSLVFVLILFSCRKSGPFAYVRGTVYDKITGQPMQGVKLYLTKSWHGGAYDRHVGSATTDLNGEYKIKYNKQVGYRYDLLSMNEVSSDFITSDNRRAALNMSLNSIGKLKVTVRKTSGSNNYISVYKNLIGSGSSPADPNPFDYDIDFNQHIYLYDNGIFEKVVSLPYLNLKANAPETIYWRVYNNGSAVGPEYDTIVQLSAGETKNIILEFN